MKETNLLLLTVAVILALQNYLIDPILSKLFSARAAALLGIVVSVLIFIVIRQYTSGF